MTLNILYLLLLLPISLLSIPSHIDNSWGINGIITNAAEGNGCAIAIQNDDKIISAIITKKEEIKQTALIRYNSDSSLDTSFNITGVLYPFENKPSIIKTIFIQNDGKILAAGHVLLDGYVHYFIFRLNNDGTFDASFGDNGKCITLLGDGCSIESVKTQSNNKILAIGHVIKRARQHLLLLRYNSDGTLDNSFIETMGESNLGKELIIQHDGKILAIGSVKINHNNKICIARFTDTGLDLNFGTNGICVSEISIEQLKAAIAENGNKLIAAGTANNAGFLAKYNYDGSPDFTFGDNGIVKFSFENKQNRFNSLAINSKILAAGSISNKALLVKFNADGTIDNSFGNNGIITSELYDSNLYHSGINSIAIQSDNKIVTNGHISNKACTTRFFPDTKPIITISNPRQNQTLNNRNININGTSSEINSKVRIFIDNNLFKTVNTNATGNWDAGISPFLAENKHTITAQIVSDNGNILKNIEHNFYIETPDLININLVDHEIVKSNSFKINGTCSKSNCPITIEIDNISNNINSDELGNWDINISELTNGTHLVTAKLELDSKIAALDSKQFSIDTKDIITITAPKHNGCANNINTICGTSSRANSSVLVYLNGEFIAHTQSDQKGHWSVKTNPVNIDKAEYIISAELINKFGNILSSASNLLLR